MKAGIVTIAASSRARPRERGLVLLECVVASGILVTAVVSVAAASDLWNQTGRDLQQRDQARAVLRAELESLCHRDGVGVFALLSGPTTASRPTGRYAGVALPDLALERQAEVVTDHPGAWRVRVRAVWRSEGAAHPDEGRRMREELAAVVFAPEVPR